MKDFVKGYLFYLTRVIRLYVAVTIIEIEKAVGIYGG